LALKKSAFALSLSDCALLKLSSKEAAEMTQSQTAQWDTSFKVLFQLQMSLRLQS
jgi:hypothetical protein